MSGGVRVWCEWCSEGVGCEWCSEGVGCEWSEGVGCEWCSEGVGCEWWSVSGMRDGMSGGVSGVRVWGEWSEGVGCEWWSVFLVLHCTVRANLAVSLFPLVPLSVPLVSAGLL